MNNNNYTFILMSPKILITNVCYNLVSFENNIENSLKDFWRILELVINNNYNSNTYIPMLIKNNHTDKIISLLFKRKNSFINILNDNFKIINEYNNDYNHYNEYNNNYNYYKNNDYNDDYKIKISQELKREYLNQLDYDTIDTNIVYKNFNKKFKDDEIELKFLIDKNIKNRFSLNIFKIKTNMSLI